MQGAGRTKRGIFAVSNYTVTGKDGWLARGLLHGTLTRRGILTTLDMGGKGQKSKKSLLFNGLTDSIEVIS
jgi:hypothetical protein